MSDRFADVNRVLETLLPAARVDGGGFQVEEIDGEGRISIRFCGACVACPSKDLTLRLGIEKSLRTELPWVSEVKRVN